MEGNVGTGPGVGGGGEIVRVRFAGYFEDCYGHFLGRGGGGFRGEGVITVRINVGGKKIC